MRGTIAPERLVVIDEDTGLISTLIDRLLRAACGTPRGWPNGKVLSFNASAIQLQDRDLGSRILAILQHTGLAPARLEIENWKSALVRDLGAARHAK